MHESYTLPQSINCNSVTNMAVPNKRLTSTIDTSVTLEIETLFKNGFSIPVTVVDRGGIPIEIPAALLRHKTSDDFVIYKTYSFSRSVKIDTVNLLAQADELLEASRLHFKKGLTAITAQIDSLKNQITLVYTLTMRTFRQFNQYAYIDELDITICSNPTIRHPVHPNSIEGTKVRTTIQIGTQFIYQIYINDPRSIYGERFVNLNSKVYRIVKQADPTMLEGVYVTLPMDVECETSGTKIYSFEEADKVLELYTTAAMAKTNGDVLGSKKREFEELQLKYKHEQLEMETQNMREKQAFQQQIYERDLKLQEADNAHKLELLALKQKQLELEKELKERQYDYDREKHYRETESMRDKNEYERRSYVRKDISELIKWLPVIIFPIMTYFLQRSKKE